MNAITKIKKVLAIMLTSFLIISCGNSSRDEIPKMVIGKEIQAHNFKIDSLKSEMGDLYRLESSLLVSPLAQKNSLNSMDSVSGGKKYCFNSILAEKCFSEGQIVKNLLSIMPNNRVQSLENLKTEFVFGLKGEAGTLWLFEFSGLDNPVWSIIDANGKILWVLIQSKEGDWKSNDEQHILDSIGVESTNFYEIDLKTISFF